MSVERRDPAICNASNIGDGKDEMTKASIDLQDLRRRIYVKAKAEPSWRFWGLYVHVCKVETLRAAYEMAKQNDGAPGVDGVTFEAIEAQGAETLLEQLRDEDGAYLQATPSPEAGDTEGWRQSPRPFDTGDPGPGGARRAQTHTRTCLRGGLPTGIVWISAQADGP